MLDVGALDCRPSGVKMMIADRPRPVACAVKNRRQPVAVLIEHRLGAAEHRRPSPDFAAHRLQRLADISVGDDQDCSIMARVRVEKKRSRPRSSVVEATTATSIVGTAAITANRLTICTCSRDPAWPRRRACTTTQTSQPDNGEQAGCRSRHCRSSSFRRPLHRGDPCQPGEHQEGGSGREQRHADGDRSDQPRRDRHRCRGCRFERRDLFGCRHEPSRERGTSEF